MYWHTEGDTPIEATMGAARTTSCFPTQWWGPRSGQGAGDFLGELFSFDNVFPFERKKMMTSTKIFGGGGGDARPLDPPTLLRVAFWRFFSQDLVA